MNNKEKIVEVALAMIDYNNGDPKRIQHTTKVHAYASLIGRREGLNEDTLFILESAALVHDIGIRASEKKYAIFVHVKSAYDSHKPNFRG